VNTYEAGNDYVWKLIDDSVLSPQPGFAPTNLKKIINGKSYNTATATTIGTWFTPTNIRNSGYFEGVESLYQKKSGEFFLVVESRGGGAPGGHIANSDHYPGYVLVPVTISQATRWAELRDMTDDAGVAEALGIDDDEEDDVPDAVNLRLSPSLMKRVTALAQKEGKSRQEWIVRCLEQCAR
jgi:hypothetical protein